MDLIKRDNIWSETARKLADAINSRRYWEQQEEHLARTLKILSENSSSTDGTYIFNKHSRKGTIDYKAIPELQNVDIEKYRKEDVESWKLTLQIKLVE